MDALNYDEEDNYTDIKPAKFYNDKDFSKELDDILLNTKDNSADWKKRESSLKKLGAMFLSEYGSTPEFIKNFNNKIYLNLSSQMLDLRSSLMKEACRIVTLAAKVYSGKIEIAAERLISPIVLYKLVNSANKLISDTGALCIGQIIKNVESGKIIIKIHEQMKNKNSTVRVRACQHMMLAQENYNKTILTKSSNLIEEFIVSTTHDPNVEVRIHARKLYFKYIELFPNQANKLFNTFEHSVQKTINEDMNNSDGNFNNSNRVSHTHSDNSNEDVVLSSNSAKSKGKQSNANFNTFQIVSSNDTKNSQIVTTSSNINRNRKTSDYSEGLASSMPRVTGDLRVSINDNIDLRPIVKTDKKEVLNRLNGMKIGNSPNIVAEDFFQNSYTTAITTTSASNLINNFSRKSTKMSFNMIRPITDNHLSQESSILNQSSIMSPSRSKKNSVTNPGPSQYFPEKSKFKNIEELIKAKINIILQAKRSEDIRIKLNAFEEISQHFNEIYSHSDYISKTTLKNLMSLHISNLKENCNKLIIQIIKNLTKFMFYIDNIFDEEDIHKIIKNIIFNISSDVEEISQNATALFEIIRKKIDTNMIIKPLLEIIQHETTEFVILEICFEFVNPLIELAVMSLSDQNYLTNFVINIAKILRRLDLDYNLNPNIKDLIHKVLESYEMIYKKYPKQFTNSFKSDKLGKELKTLVISLLYRSNRKNFADYLKQITDNFKSSYETDSSKSGSLNNTMNYYSTNTNSYIDPQNTNTIHTANITNNTVSTSNIFKTTPNSNNYYHSSNHNGFNYDENLNLSDVNYDVLKIAYNNKITVFVGYLNSDPNSNTENFLLALNRVKYEQVFFILNHIYFILDSEEHKYLFGDNLSLFINRVIFLLDKFYTEYSQQINEIINLIPIKLDKEMYLQLLPKYITSRQSPHIVQILLLSIKNVVNLIEQENLLLLLPSFIETVFNTLSHSISDVRKYAVYCIVDIYLILGKDFDAYLNELNSSQKNLINIYVKKKLENNS